MSMPPSSATMSKPMEDCRDYLRTGRCKYGASCKYNHPANVLNGGGIKPLDPSEPMFPIRPNEPICQYYMKHGTCKFGQACKFHHPPVGSLGSIPMGFGSRRPDPAPQMLLNPVGTDPSGQGMMLQFLPQRPDEPDCIYFLKNGRCKYGATCRYHHPVHPQARRQPDKRRQPVQYVTQVLPSYANQVGQVVMSSQDNPVTFISVDGGTASTASTQSSYQVFQGGDGVTTYCLPQGSVFVTDQGSSASSMASSFETAQDHLGDSQWGPRPKRNGSGSSLNAIDTSRQARSFLPHVASEGNMSHRRNRAASHGSSSDHSGSYFDVPTQVPASQRSTSMGSWSQRVQGAQYRQESGAGRIPTATANRRAVNQRSPRGRHQGSDEGFTMMTSALLNMLDHTTEEVADESLSDEEYQPQSSRAYHGSTHATSSAFSPELKSQMDDLTDPTMISQLSLNGLEAPSSQLSPQASRDEASSWSPTWRGAVHEPNERVEEFPALQRTPAPHQASAHESDVGLYLP